MPVDADADSGDAVPPSPAVVVLSDPCHALVTEDGSFRAGSDRQRRLCFEPKNYWRLARLFGALDAVHRLNTAGRSATQRELFYRATAEAPSLFRVQDHMNKALLDAVGAVRIGRPHLGVITTEKGLVAGAVSFRDLLSSSSATATCGAGAHGASAHSVGGIAIGERMLRSDDCGIDIDVGAAHCVLVVEKDTFFQHLLQGRLLATLPLVLVTGRGIPDMLTRRLLQRLHRIAPKLPQVYLGDYDPYGVLIFLTYRASCPSLKWLGMHEADVRDLPQKASLALTPRDRAVRASLLRHPQVHSNEAFAAQVHGMVRKFELEALHAKHSPEEIARHVVPGKILRREWL